MLRYTEKTMDVDVCIIGQGLTGLVAALKLKAAGRSVLLLEKDKKCGGLAGDMPLGNTRIEHIYHHCFANDFSLIELLRTLCIEDRLQWYEPKNGLFSNGHLYSFTTPLDLLSCRSISLPDRIRTGLTVLQAKRVNDWKPLEHETARDYLVRRSGKTAYERIWQPLLLAKFGDDADSVSAVWIWNKFKVRGASRDKSQRAEKLGYLKDGFGTLVSAIVEKLKADDEKRVTLMNNVEVEAIEKTKTGFEIQTNDGTHKAKQVIAAVAAPMFNHLTKTLDLGTYRDLLNVTKYKANICLLLSFDRQVTPYYWTTICDDLPFVVIVEQTNLVAKEVYGSHLLYLSCYLDTSDPLWLKNDDEIEAQFLAGLWSLFPDAEGSFQKKLSLIRSQYAQPVIPTLYSQKQPGIRTPIEGLYLAGMSQIYPEDRGLNYAIKLGKDVAKAVLEKNDV